VFIEAKDDGGGEWWQLGYWSYKSCKAPVKSSSPTNNIRFFLQTRCPSCRPTNSVKALQGRCKWSWSTHFKVRVVSTINSIISSAVQPRTAWHSGTGLLRLPWKPAVKWVWHIGGCDTNVCCVQASVAAVRAEESVCVLEVQLWILAAWQHVSHGTVALLCLHVIASASSSRPRSFVLLFAHRWAG